MPTTHSLFSSRRRRWLRPDPRQLLLPFRPIFLGLAVAHNTARLHTERFFSGLRALHRRLSYDPFAPARALWQALMGRTPWPVQSSASPDL